MSSKNRKVDYLCIGHVCHDVVAEGFALGGTASYASITSSKLGLNTSILTSYADNFLFEDYLSSLNLHLQVAPSEETTTFENIYESGTRVQFMHHRASQLTSINIPKAWLNSKIIHLCLIADEVSENLMINLPSEALIGLALQGATRTLDPHNKVINAMTDLSRFRGVDVVFYSEDDIIGLKGIEEQLIEIIPMLVRTSGNHGATIKTRNKSRFYPSYPANEIDPTGAGDVFSAAFLVAYAEESNIEQACAFAHAAASLSIEGHGVNAIPTLDKITTRLSEYYKFLSSYNEKGHR